MLRHFPFTPNLRKLVLVGAILSAASLTAQPGEIDFDYLGLADGLSNEVVTSIVQDPYGFIWIGTYSGLNRYDGRSILQYRPDKNNPYALSDDGIRALHVDRAGRLWIGTERGLNRYDFATERFLPATGSARDTSLINRIVISDIAEDTNGNLWIGSAYQLSGNLWSGSAYQLGGLNSRLMYLDPERQTYEEFELFAPASNSYIKSIVYHHPDTLYIAAVAGSTSLYLFDIQKKHFKSIDEPAYYKGFSSTICKSSEGWIWASSRGGVSLDKIQISRSGIELTPEIHWATPPLIRNIFEDHNRNLWLLSINSGLYSYSPCTRELKNYGFTSGSPDSLAGLPWTLYEDKDGNIWIGTIKGLNVIKSQKKPFRHFATDTENPDALPEGEVTGVACDPQGSLWISVVNKGIFQYAPENNVFKRFHLLEDVVANWSIEAIAAARSGDIWFGETRSGICRFNPTSGEVHRFRHDPDDPDTPGFHRVFRIFEGRRGRIWFAGLGLNYYDPERDKFKRFYHSAADSTSLSTDPFYTIYQDEQNRLWFGGASNALHLFDEEHERFQRFLCYAPEDCPYEIKEIFDIVMDTRGHHWLGTNAGLFEYDWSSGQISIPDLPEETLGKTVMGIIEVDAGDLWALGTQHLSRYSPLNRESMVFGCGDGWIQNHLFVNSKPFAKMSDGRIAAGGLSGLTIFHPEEIRINSMIAPVHLTGFEVFYQPVTLTENNVFEGDSILTQSLLTTEHITLRHNQNTFSFQFAALEYTASERNQYAYKLEGFQEDWVQNGTSNFASFTNVPPGEYTFRVKGANNDGVWNEEGASLGITILPPWWKTWWAYTFYTILVFGLLYGIRRFELNRQNLKHELKLEHVEREKMKQVDRMKSRFFANISHEFRTPLTLIRGPVQQLRSGEFTGNIKEQCDLVLRNCNRLLRLINQLLDLSKLESDRMTLQARPENIVALTRQLTMAFESLAKRRQIELSFQASTDEMTAYIDRDKFEKIVTNLLSNAFKFTSPGDQVTVHITGRGMARHIPTDAANGHFIDIYVSDSGTGIPADRLPHIFERFVQVDDSAVREHSGTGIGLALVKELVELHHGDISVQSAPGEGTKFTVRLPLGKTHLTPEEIAEQSAESETPGAEYSPDEAALPADGAPLQPARDSASPAATDRRGTEKRDAPPAHRILIVEDNPDMRAYIHSSLDGTYKTVEAEDGAEGLKAALKTTPDLIISDVMIPKMDGYQFCEKIKTNPRTSHIPVILLTAKASRDSKLEGLETGADDYLTKPFDAKELRVRIKNLIEQRSKLRELFQRQLQVEPKVITVTSTDEKFLQRAMEIVEENIDDSEFDTRALSRAVGLGRSQLNVKLRALTGYSTREFIRTLRLKRAAQLLQQRFGNVAEVAYEVGFNSLSHFSKVFKQQFGVLPSQYDPR